MFKHRFFTFFSIFGVLFSCVKETQLRDDDSPCVISRSDFSIRPSTQIYYWQLHVSNFKRSAFLSADRSRHSHLLIKLLLSNQVESNPGPANLDSTSLRNKPHARRPGRVKFIPGLQKSTNRRPDGRVLKFADSKLLSVSKLPVWINCVKRHQFMYIRLSFAYFCNLIMHNLF